MGGEKEGQTRFHSRPSGSPPHGRGKERVNRCACWTEWITPAWAGKRGCMKRLSAVSGDHPRMGGEKFDNPKIDNSQLGSPPHGRGKGHLSRPLDVSGGITPAWAGKSRPGVIIAGDFRDHPRMGGEKSLLLAWSRRLLGSPPHGRGKGRVQPGSGPDGGITPAWAGKSNGQIVLDFRPQDHPRMGGEKTKKIP